MTQRTFGWYGNETTPPEIQPGLQREDQAAVTAARPVTVTIGDLITLAGQLTRDDGDYNDAVHSEGICRDAFAALITRAARLDDARRAGIEHEITAAIRAAEQTAGGGEQETGT
jgi:hypothetical protein